MTVTTPQYPLLIGLTGPFGSGATSVARLLKKKGFQHIEPHEIIKREMKLEPESVPKDDRRKLYQDAGNKLRKKKGLGYLVTAALAERADKSKPTVVDSLKNPAEVQELLRQPNSCVVAICADEEIRWNRVYKDGKYEKRRAFERDDHRDKYEPDRYGQNVRSCVDLADILIVNEEQYDSPAQRSLNLTQTIGKYLEMMKKPGSRPPSEGEVFMGQAYQMSLYSRCLKRQVGAMVTTTQVFPLGTDNKKPDEREVAISSACNQPPPGQKACADALGRCYRDEGYEKYLVSLKHCPSCSAKREGSTSRYCSNCGVIFPRFSGHMEKKVYHGIGGSFGTETTESLYS
jgi:dephospho-CoA kinase